MGYFGDDSENANAAYEVYGTEGSKSHWSNELIGGAAAFSAMKALQEWEGSHGKPANQADAQQLVAGFSGAAVDHIIETKGLDFIDVASAKRYAQSEAESALENGDGFF